MTKEYFNNLCYYTGKWFLIWGFKIFLVGLVGALTLTAAVVAMANSSKKSE